MSAANDTEPIYADPYTRLAWKQERIDALLAENQRLEEWDEATWPLIGALAVYGEDASLTALVTKAQEIVAAREALRSEQ